MALPALQVLAFALGGTLVFLTLRSAVQTFVLPRARRDTITRIVFLAMRALFDLRVRQARTYAERDRVMALYAPLSLLMLVPTWLALLLVGYAAMFWALGGIAWQDAITESGSALLTLGFAPANSLPGAALMFSEATIGLIMIALLIAYLPTMYTAFSRREAAVALLEVRAGSPPSALEMIARFHRLHGLERLRDVWVNWENWFTDVEETHTSLAPLVFFRSPQPDRSWVTASGAVLDAAALVNAVVDVPHDIQADLCIRAGYLMLRRIADFFGVPYDPDPRPEDPISIAREEFDAACDALEQRGVPLLPDRDAAWRAFAGWRVNYDRVLLALAALTMAPYAPWSSDRSLLAAPARGGLARR